LKQQNPVLKIKKYDLINRNPSMLMVTLLFSQVQAIKLAATSNTNSGHGLMVPY